MTLHELTVCAMQIRAQYAAFEKATYGRAWRTEKLSLGFVGDASGL